MSNLLTLTVLAQQSDEGCRDFFPCWMSKRTVEVVEASKRPAATVKYLVSRNGRLDRLEYRVRGIPNLDQGNLIHTWLLLSETAICFEQQKAARCSNPRLPSVAKSFAPVLTIAPSNHLVFAAGYEQLAPKVEEGARDVVGMAAPCRLGIFLCTICRFAASSGWCR